MGYNSPWSTRNRRNEVWIAKEDVVENRKGEDDEGDDDAAAAVEENDEEYEDDIESLPYEVVLQEKVRIDLYSRSNKQLNSISILQDYELRKYPASKWVCNSLANYDFVSNDILAGWKDKFASPMEAMDYRKKIEGRDAPRRQLFKRYACGNGLFELHGLHSRLDYFLTFKIQSIG